MSHTVVPYIGTWIETINDFRNVNAYQVVPYIGTWIETQSTQESI